MITTQNMMPITGDRGQAKPRKSIPANQAETSKDLEERLLAGPQPFTYENGAAQAPTGRHDGSKEGEPYGVAASVNARPQSMGTHVGCANTSETNYEATGDKKPKGYNSIDSGFPKGAPREIGGGNQPKARGRK